MVSRMTAPGARPARSESMPSERDIWSTLPEPPVTASLFVIGTDTGVGKTHVCTALLRGLTAQGLRAVGMKPVAAGATLDTVSGEWVNDDARLLRAASNVRVPALLDNPVLLREPMSPHLAAQRERRSIAVAPLVSAHRELTKLAQAIVIEGAGGFMVPLQADTSGALITGADLALAMKVPMLLVVGLRLGCLNHALLTAEALHARGLHLHGWIANRVDPAMQGADDNIAFLRRHLPAPLLADVPHGFDGALDIEWPP